MKTVGDYSLLIGFVALLMGNCSPIWAHPCVAPVVTTEAGPSFLSECVKVGYLAPHEDRSGAVLQHLNMLRGQWCITRMIDCEGATWANGTAGCCPHKIRGSAHEFCDERKIPEPYTTPRNNFGCRSEAGIPDDHISRWLLTKLYIRDNQFMRENVSSQLAPGSVLRAENQPSGSEPQEDSRSTKDNGEGRYDNRAKGDPKLVMRLEHTDEPGGPGSVGLGFLFAPAVAVVIGGLSSRRLILWGSLGVLACWLVCVFVLMLGALGWPLL